MTKHLKSILIVFILAACGPKFDVSNDTAGANYVTLAGNSIPEGTNLQQAEKASVQPSASRTIPLDGPQYQQDLVEIRTAFQSKNPGRLLNLPTGVSKTGYPLYAAICVFFPTDAECLLDNGEIVDEDYLVARTTVIRNVDVMRPELTCGKICVDQEGRVLGHVSNEMLLWRDRHCQWLGYGTPQCK